MNRITALSILIAAAILEAAGDAVLRAGLKSGNLSLRLLLFLIGAALLFAYGWLINTTPWNFGQLLGLYIVFFFIAAQLISWLAFAQPPSTVVLIGGSLIVSGGLVIALWGGV